MVWMEPVAAYFMVLYLIHLQCLRKTTETPIRIGSVLWAKLSSQMEGKKTCSVLPLLVIPVASVSSDAEDFS